MVDFRGVDHDPGWINRRLREIDRKIEALRSERRAAATTITDGDLLIRGGGKLVVDGGDFLLLDTDGSTVFRLGPQVHGDRGVTLSRESGTEALSVSKLFPGGDQQVRMRDRSGNELVGEEALGNGLSRPYLSLPMQPVLATPGPVTAGPHGFEVTTAATSWEPVFHARFPRQNQFMSVRLRIAASDDTTAGEVRMVDAIGGGHLGQFLAGPYTATRAAGSTDYVEVPLFGIVVHGAFTESIAVGIEVQRTAGTGTLTVAVVESRGGIQA